jgi:hypothetical protein
MISSRHQSISGGGGDGNLRSNSIDENSYDDLTKVRKMIFSILTNIRISGTCNIT